MCRGDTFLYMETNLGSAQTLSLEQANLNATNTCEIKCQINPTPLSLFVAFRVKFQW